MKSPEMYRYNFKYLKIKQKHVYKYFDFIKTYDHVQSLFNITILFLLNLIYGDLIYLWNQNKICALQGHEFRCKLLNEIWCS